MISWFIVVVVIVLSGTVDSFQFTYTRKRGTLCMIQRKSGKFTKPSKNASVKNFARKDYGTRKERFSPRNSARYSSPIGYQRGCLSTMQNMFQENSWNGLISFASFQASRYLRFWPGNANEAQKYWESILGSIEIPCNYDNMVEFHKLLDAKALEIEEEMLQVDE
jgi:hypothetical protein